MSEGVDVIKAGGIAVAEQQLTPVCSLPPVVESVGCFGGNVGFLKR